MNKFLSYLCILPSVTFGIIPAEIFPWAFIKSLNNIKKLWFEYLILFLLFMPALIIGISATGFKIETVRSASSFINAIILFFLIIKYNETCLNRLIKVLKTILFLQIGIGLFQFLIDLPIFDHFINFIVPRAKTSADFRGVSGLSSEPARQALEIVLIYSTFITVSAHKYSRRKRSLIDLVIFTYLAFINKSVTGVGLFFIYALFTRFSFKSIIKLSLVSVIMVLFIKFLPDTIKDRNRFLALAGDLANSNLNKTEFIIKQSGFRIPSILTVYSRPTILGYGFGNWRLGIRESLLNNQNLQYKLTKSANQLILGGVRPMSFSSGLILEGGLYLSISVLIMLFLSIPIIKSAYFHSKYFANLISKTIIFIIFSLLFIGTIGSPIPFICLGLLFKSKYQNYRFGIEKYVFTKKSIPK